MRVYSLLFIAFFISLSAFSQDKNLDKKMKRMLNVKEIEWDHYNEDGVFKARSKKSGKWGMYQNIYQGKRPKNLVPMKYDSLGFYDHSSNYTIVKNNGKYGLLSSPWSGHSKLFVRCMYQQLNYVDDHSRLIAAKGNNKWAYIDTETGDTLIPFVHNNHADLPAPSSYFYKFPMREYPEKLMKIMENPEAVTEIDLSRLNLTYLPDVIGECVNAKSVNLEQNKLSSLPNSLFELPNIDKLYLGSNPGLLEFDNRFAKFTKLKVLYIGSIMGSGTLSYLRESYKFGEEMMKLQNLQILAFYGYFNSNGDIPDFVYQLPNLKKLYLEGVFGFEYDKMDLQKLKCRDSLEVLNIETLESFENMNLSMKYFPNLERVSIKTYNHKQTPLWINDLKALTTIKIVHYSKREGSGYYDGKTVVGNSWGYFSDEIMTDEERKEALKKWADYIKSLDE